MGAAAAAAGAVGVLYKCTRGGGDPGNSARVGGYLEALEAEDPLSEQHTLCHWSGHRHANRDQRPEIFTGCEAVGMF